MVTTAAAATAHLDRVHRAAAPSPESPAKMQRVGGAGALEDGEVVASLPEAPGAPDGAPDTSSDTSSDTSDDTSDSSDDDAQSFYLVQVRSAQGLTAPLTLTCMLSEAARKDVAAINYTGADLACVCIAVSSAAAAKRIIEELLAKHMVAEMHTEHSP